MNKNYFIILIFIISNSVLSQENWTIYNTSNSDLSFNVITDIEFDSEGNKWIASWYNNGGAGIAKFDDTNWTIFNTENQQGTNEIHRIEFSTGTLGISVSVYATTVVNFADGTQTEIYSNHDRDNNILIVEIPVNATNFEIDYYIENSSTVEMEFYNIETNSILHQETFTAQTNYEYDYVFFSNIITNQVIDISIDNLDNKWIGTWQNGLMKFDDENWINYTAENSDLPNNNIFCLATDNDNNVWIGTSSGLTKFDGTNWTNYNTTNSNLPTNWIPTIAIDDNNNIWIWTGYLVEFTGNTWNIYNDNDVGVSGGGGANSLRIDSNNKKWMSAGYGINSFDGSNWEYFNYFGSNNSCLLDCQITSLAFDVNSNIWLGAQQECSNGGLLNFSECNSYLTSNSGLPDNSILSLNIDSNGIKWIGTINGLAKLDNQSLSTDENNFADIYIKFYPNPVNNYLNIKIKDILKNSKFSIFQINGKTIKTGSLKTNLNTINLEELSKGVYFLKIEKDDLTRTIKIIK